MLNLLQVALQQDNDFYHHAVMISDEYVGCTVGLHHILVAW